MKFSLKVAWRFLTSNKAQSFLIMLGIGVGIAVQLFISLLIDGLQQDLINTTIGTSPHVIISSTDDKRIIFNEDEIKGIIRNNDLGIIKKINYTIQSPSIVNINDKNVSVFVRGFNLDSADEIYQISERIIEGNMPLNEGEVLIGVGFSKEQNVNIGDEITLLNFEDGFLRNTATISGIFDFRITNLNNSWVIADINTARKFYNIESGVNIIEFQITEVFEADALSDKLQSELREYNLKIENWKQQNEDLLSGLMGQSVSSLIIQIFVVIAVALGIASVLIITVLQKSKQIGILKAMGTNNKQASFIFLLQGLFLGIGGAIIGIIIGMLLILSFSVFAMDTSGEAIVNIDFRFRYLIISFIIAVGSAVISSVFPARRSSKLDPVEVIRNG